MIEKSKSVLIAGVAGFLGSHLAEHHLKKGDKVFSVDNFCSSNNESSHFKNLLSQKNFSFEEHDIVTPLLNDWLTIANQPIDIIYNLACPASPPIYQKIPIQTMLTCVQGTNNLLEVARNKKAVFVQASTSEVYGDPNCSQQAETYRGSVNCYGPRSNYDEGKRAAEALCYDWLHQHKVDARVMRIFNTYGPHMDPNDGRVVSNFIKQALKNEDITIYGDGSQTRSFCYVDDLIKAIVAIGSLKENPKTPINIGNPGEFTIKELCDMVIDKTKSKSKVTYHKLPVDDPLQRKPNITLAKNILGWKPEIELSKGLEKTISYFKSVL